MPVQFQDGNMPDNVDKDEQLEKLREVCAEKEKYVLRIESINRDLENACTAAETRNREKSSFLANMSHELRTPMNGILGFAEMLKKPGLSAQKQSLFIQIIEQSGQRMLNIIDDIINISNIEAGLVELSPVKINLNIILKQLYDFFLPEAEKKGLWLNLQIPVNESTIKTDRQKLEQVISNLIKNALKFTDKGRIEIGYHNNGADLTIFIRDTGIGISTTDQANIFNRFWKKSKMHEGSGLGLAISKSYTEMMGGNISVKSDEGAGSCFYIDFPLKKL